MSRFDIPGYASSELPGEQIVEDLREAGFVVLDYEQCSDTLNGIHSLLFIRETYSGETLFDAVESPSFTIRPSSAVLDVVLTSGTPCTSRLGAAPT